jgi:alpha-L-arabinofuranosidase B-like protein
VRHAHAVRISMDELDALIASHGVSEHLRTTYSEGGGPFYVAHSWFHSMITTLDDRERGQLADDFLWKVVPGLADPADPELVSFEAVGYPGRYLRIDSANPARYPSCDEPSNRSWGLCWVASESRHHLGWVDAHEETATFEGDATFRRTPALNGDASMISLQWYVDPTRYLRHVAYQVFATPISGSVEQNDASFVLERE